MGRFSVDNSIEARAFDRQGGLCGACGKKLCFEAFQTGDWGAWNAHHVDGDPLNNSISNCVCLCINPPEECHLLVGHVGDFNGPSVATRTSYPFLMGAEGSPSAAAERCRGRMKSRQQCPYPALDGLNGFCGVHGAVRGYRCEGVVAATGRRCTNQPRPRGKYCRKH